MSRARIAECASPHRFVVCARPSLRTPQPPSDRGRLRVDRKRSAVCGILRGGLLRVRAGLCVLADEARDGGSGLLR